VTSSTTATLPIAKLTEGSNLPVVFLSSANPLTLVKSYASSGNNLTGISDSTLDIIGKQMELLKELLPRAKRVMSVVVSGETNYKQVRHLTHEAAKKLGLVVVDVVVDKPEEIKAKLAILIERKAGDAIFASLNLSMLAMRDEIIQQGVLGGIPIIATGIETVRKGALAAYTSDFFALGAQGALLVDKILKGARPSDLPIEQPSKLKLIINLKAAKTVGLKIPKEVLLRANDLIE
jgi:putative ABC transport system substrate-binding protein